MSSFGSDFNFDYHVSFKDDEVGKDGDYNYERQEIGSDEMPGASVFYKDEYGTVFHTYSAYARGLDILLGAYNFLDLTPKGRDEAELAWSMAWVRHHDKYANAAPSHSCCSHAERREVAQVSQGARHGNRRAEDPALPLVRRSGRGRCEVLLLDLQGLAHRDHQPLRQGGARDSWAP